MGWLCTRCGTKYYDRQEALRCCKKEKPDKPSADYVKGFKHGVKWCRTMMKVKADETVLVDLEKVVKSLKEGR